ncbi:MAG: maltokinase, partial [Thermoanaerobacter sp.]|nr:maltokinase [Thermoanaerobacter sp.]
MYISKTFNFEDIPTKLKDILKNINKDNFKKFRWFQEKAYDILDIFLFDYAILSKKEAEVIIAAIIAFVVKASTSNKEIMLLYYVPLIITPYFRNNDLIDIIESPNLKAFIYDGIDDINYVKFLNKALNEETVIKFESGAKLIPYNLKKDDIYSARRLSNKSSNSLTFLQKNEIIKTYRKFVKGVNPDLEMTFELKNAGFGNVQ